MILGATGRAAGRGIPVGRVCDRCVESVLSRYRPEILNRRYDERDVDEPIEEDL